MVTLTNPTTGQEFEAVLLDESPQLVPSGAHYERGIKWNCGCKKIDENMGCDEKGHVVYSVTIGDQTVRVPLCAIHQQLLRAKNNNLTIVPDNVVWDIEIPMNVVNEEGVVTGQTNIAVSVNGGCLELLSRLILNGHMTIRNVAPAENNEDFQQRYNDMVAAGMWDHETGGVQRGCQILVSKGWVELRDIIREYLPFEEAEYRRIEESDERKFYMIIAAAYVGKGRRKSKSGHGYICFSPHCDRYYYGKFKDRTNRSWGNSITAHKGFPKCTRFSNRCTGEWISIICPNGTSLTGDDYCYGWDESHEMEHAVYNATGGITSTFDHGHADEEVTEAMLAAAAEATLGAGNVGDLDDNDEDDWDSDEEEEEEEEEGEEEEGDWVIDH